jgi:hypothetical protein
MMMGAVAMRGPGLEINPHFRKGSTAAFKRRLRHVRYHPNSGAIGHFALACNVAAIGVGYRHGCF